MKSRRLCAALLWLFACGDDDGTINPDSGMDSGPGTDSGAVDAGGTDAGPGPDDAGPGDAGTDAAAPTGWTVRTHPCPGINRTDAFFVDADGTMWLGCGSGTVGDGLFVSSDGGASWAIPATQPANVLTSFRVLSVHRGFDDLVYVAGEGPARSMVISLDTSSAPFAAETVLTRGTTVGTSFLASPFLTTASGAAFADSFNGSDALYRPDSSVDDAAASWVDAGDWETDGGSHQILDLVALGERFVGCGSTIAEPPLVFLPSEAADAEPWEMTPIDLVGSGLGSYTGEMWGVAASDDRVVAVGVDQDNDIGKIFVSGADRYSQSDYTQIDVDPLLPSRVSGADSTWARGVCMRGDRVVVVGEIQPLGAGDNTGFVLESLDGGATFADVTPEGSPDTWSKCSLEGDVLRVAGAGAVAIQN
ncbi:MAG: hypothetical protein AAGE52_27810 [Myxococcota bacterium]